jgi:hypothetical protein
VEAFEGKHKVGKYEFLVQSRAKTLTLPGFIPFAKQLRNSDLSRQHFLKANDSEHLFCPITILHSAAGRCHPDAALSGRNLASFILLSKMPGPPRSPVA